MTGTTHDPNGHTQTVSADLSRASRSLHRSGSIERHRGDIDLAPPVIIPDPDPVRDPEPVIVAVNPVAAPLALDQAIRERVRTVLAEQHAPRRPVYETAKRGLDIAVSASLLLVTAPIIAVLCVIIRVESKGRAVFRQRRVARGGHVIEFCKFRTMYTDAKERFPELYDYSFTEEEFATSYYKPAVDPRNTRFGRALRKTTLDELPNLFNVIRGDVSLVGPRPELPELIQYYSDEQLAKFSVKSGITGLAQVSGRNNLSIQEQIALDLEYVARRSFAYDLRLIGRTLVMVLKRVGAE